MTSQSKLTDTQLILLAAASQRDDGLLVQPTRLRGGAAQAVTGPLLASGYVEEVEVGRDDPHWREAEDGAPIGLRITAAGLTVLGIAGEDESDGTGATAEGSAAASMTDQAPASESRPHPSVRAGTKQAVVLSLLERGQGATIADLTSATGWLPHTTRAALTGLRQNGHDIWKAKNDQGQTVYRTGPTGTNTATAELTEPQASAEQV